MKRKPAIISLRKYKLTKAEKLILKSEKPWGVILFKRNIKSFDQTRKLTNEIRKCLNDPFYPILIDNRDKVAKKLLNSHGIDTRIAYPMPIYEQPIYKNQICKSRHHRCPNALYISSRILNLPIFPDMKKNQIKYVVRCLNNSLI